MPGCDPSRSLVPAVLSARGVHVPGLRPCFLRSSLPGSGVSQFVCLTHGAQASKGFADVSALTTPQPCPVGSLSPETDRAFGLEE